MIPDLNLQTKSGWKAVVDGVGGHPPALYGYKQYSFTMGFYVQGIKGQFNDWLAAIARPIPVAAPTGLALEFDAIFSFTAAQFAQALEFDTILTLKQLKYNCSFQINVAAGWQLQISAANGSWVNIGQQIAPLAPDVPHRFLMVYRFDTVKKVYSFVSVTIDGATYTIPPGLQNLPATVTNWADVCSLQVQQDTNAQGGSFSQVLANVNYFWEE